MEVGRNIQEKARESVLNFITWVLHLQLSGVKKHTFDIPLHVLVGAEIVVTTSFL